jgi:RNA polymerase sigma-70 factor (ECF subfamily)
MRIHIEVALRFPPMTSDADLDLIEGLLARDADRLQEVIALYGGAVYGMARRVLGESASAEEVAQDTFLALWRRPGAFNPERGTLKSFLLGVARNKAIDLVRKEASRRRVREELMSEFSSQLEEPVDDLSEAWDLKNSLKSIPPVQREAIVLAYFGGRTYREVAQELGIPEGTAKTRLRDGLKRMKEVMTTNEADDG